MKVTSFVLLASLPALVSASFDVTVCFELDGSGVENAEVQCYDADWGTDDKVGPYPAWTDSNGCVTITDNQSWWENPDVYCTIEANDECFATTTTDIEDDHNDNYDLDMGTIDLTYDEDYCGVFGSETNGCGPESFPSWANDMATQLSGFDTQCLVHDACYADCTKTRSQCDLDFYDDMDGECSTGSFTCHFLAHVFYEAVDAAGQDACEASRDHCDSAGFARCDQ